MNRRREVAERYDTFVDPYIEHWAPVLRAFSEPLLARLPADGARILDLGCGPGVVSRALLERGATVVGVDIAEEMLRRAPFACLVGDVERLPFAGGAFDAAVSTFVLQHIPWASRVFAEACRVLRPAGAFATATWGADVIETGGPWDVAWAALEAERPPPAEGIKTWHARVDSPAKVRRMARRAGFAEIEAWQEEMAYRWSRDGFLGWVRCQRVFGRRLAALSEEAQARVLARIDDEVGALTDEQMVWRADVVFCVASRGD